MVPRPAPFPEPRPARVPRPDPPADPQLVVMQQPRPAHPRLALAAATLLAACSALSAQTWTPTAAGTHDWDNSGNWSAAFPNAIDAAADLSADLSGNQT